jgi:hypothetical protein
MMTLHPSLRSSRAVSAERRLTLDRSIGMAPSTNDIAVAFTVESKKKSDAAATTTLWRRWTGIAERSTAVSTWELWLAAKITGPLILDNASAPVTEVGAIVFTRGEEMKSTKTARANRAG